MKKSLALFRDSGDMRGIASVLTNLGMMQSGTGRLRAGGQVV